MISIVCIRKKIHSCSSRKRAVTYKRDWYIGRSWGENALRARMLAQAKWWLHVGSSFV